MWRCPIEPGALIYGLGCASGQEPGLRLNLALLLGSCTLSRALHRVSGLELRDQMWKVGKHHLVSKQI